MNNEGAPLSVSEKVSEKCIRQCGRPAFDFRLCEKCYGTYKRFCLERGGGKNPTVEEFIEKCPLRQTRREPTDGEHSEGVNQLIPGFFVGGSATLKLVEHVRQIADDPDIPVIIYGETGVGKELVARGIHDLSLRKKNRWLAVNCATIQEHVAESEFFGHERGSFTGATHKTNGIYVDVDQGTLFLDEIETLTLSVQAKLLRTLESGEVRPVGSTRSRLVNVRTIAATNEQLEDLCGSKRFRSDLYYRLEGVAITIPPLRERVEEIEPLARHLLTQVSRYAREFDERVIDAFQHYHWPGNIRELRNALRSACLYAGDLIDLAHIPTKIWKREGTVAVGR